jgi:hypothetical protein
MGSLQSRHKSLSQLVPSVCLRDMVHVIGGVICPVSALFGNPGVHTNNGVYVARRLPPLPGDNHGGDVVGPVYASCAHCVFDKAAWRRHTQLVEDRLVEIVAGGEDMKYPWVVYTRDNYPLIIATATTAAAPARSRTHPAQSSSAKIPRKKKELEGGGTL